MPKKKVTETVNEIATEMSIECLGFKTMSLARSVSRLYNDALRDRGLTVTQYSLLAAITLYEPVQPAELARKVNIEKSTLTRNTKLMEANGWIQTCEGNQPGSLELSTTRKGKSIIKLARPAWKEAQSEAKSFLGEKLIKELLEHKVNK